MPDNLITKGARTTGRVARGATRTASRARNAISGTASAVGGTVGGVVGGTGAAIDGAVESLDEAGRSLSQHIRNAYEHGRTGRNPEAIIPQSTSLVPYTGGAGAGATRQASNQAAEGVARKTTKMASNQASDVIPQAGRQASNKAINPIRGLGRAIKKHPIVAGGVALGGAGAVGLLHKRRSRRAQEEDIRRGRR